MAKTEKGHGNRVLVMFIFSFLTVAGQLGMFS